MKGIINGASRNSICMMLAYTSLGTEEIRYKLVIEQVVIYLPLLKLSRIYKEDANYCPL